MKAMLSQGNSSDDEDEDEDERKFLERASKFVSSFCLNDAVKNKEKASLEFKKLHEELTEGYETTEEIVRTKNLMSFLQWQLRNRDAARQYCDAVLEIEENNIIALTNKTYFMFYTEEIAAANISLGILDDMIKIPEYNTLMNNATAELAYSYSRFGPKFHSKSVELFEKAIAENPDNDLWKFGLALTYRRRTHILNNPSLSKIEFDWYTIKALTLLHEITSSKKINALQAKAWCELGQIIHWEYNQVQKLHLSQSIKSLGSEECLQHALDLCPNDTFVLQRCGKHFRYLKKLDKSKELLERAISIRKTPFNLHHLGLTLVKQADIENKNRRRIPRYFNQDEKSSEKTLSSRHSRNPDSYNVSRLDENIVDSMTSLTLSTRSKQIPEMTHTNKANNGREQMGSENSNRMIPSPCHGRGRSRYQGNLQKFGRGGSKQMSLDTPVNRLCIKSPMKTMIDPNNYLLLQAEQCLHRAIDLTQGQFPSASYELGLVYRRLNQIENAMKAFNDVSLAKDASKLEKVRAIEQIGICKLLLFENPNCSPEDSTKYYKDAKAILFKAVRQMASLCSTLPNLGYSLSCYPTLSNLLEGKPFYQIDSRKELAELHRLVGNYKEAISCYEEVRGIMGQKTPEDILLNLIECYKKIDDYEQAVFILNMLWCSSDYRKFVNKSVYVSLHIDAWLHEIKNKNNDQAIQYLNCAYQVVKRSNRDSETTQKEVVVLCACGDVCDIYTAVIKENLENVCGLSSTLNASECLPGRPTIGYLEEILEACGVILLLIHDQEVTYSDEYPIQMTLSNESFKAKALLIADNVKQPTMKTLPRLEYPTEGVDMCEWIYKLLVSVLKC